MSTLTLSRTGEIFLKQEEGYKTKAYADGGGYSVCWGHYGVSSGYVATPAQCQAFFDADKAWAEKAVNDLGVKLAQNQFDALVSFAYNLGEPNFKASRVVKLVKQNPNHSGITDAFLSHNTSQGIVSPVLTARRYREAEMYTNTAFKNKVFIGIGIGLIGLGALYFATR